MTPDSPALPHDGVQLFAADWRKVAQKPSASRIEFWRRLFFRPGGKGNRRARDAQRLGLRRDDERQLIADAFADEVVDPHVRRIPHWIIVQHGWPPLVDAASGEEPQPFGVLRRADRCLRTLAKIAGDGAEVPEGVEYARARVPGLEELLIEMASPSTAQVDVDALAEWRAALTKLGAEERALAIEAHRLSGGLSQAEVCEALGVSHGAHRKALHQARRRRGISAPRGRTAGRRRHAR